jgi:hypothetical protein
MTYFKCDTCTKCININISDTLDYDLSQVTVRYYLNNACCVFNDESKAKILAHIDKQLVANNHICDQTNHVQVSYGNDGPFFSFYLLMTKKYTVAYAVLLNPDNDTFRIYDE